MIFIPTLHESPAFSRKANVQNIEQRRKNQDRKETVLQTKKIPVMYRIIVPYIHAESPRFSITRVRSRSQVRKLPFRGCFWTPHLNTDLMWQQGDAHNGSTRTWQQAVDYCAASDLANYHDWRLPSITELTSIVDHSRTNPAINITYFPGCRSSNYWSGTTVAYYPYYAWSVYFNNGAGYWSNKGFNCYVRCVRGGP